MPTDAISTGINVLFVKARATSRMRDLLANQSLSGRSNRLVFVRWRNRVKKISHRGNKKIVHRICRVCRRNGPWFFKTCPLGVPRPTASWPRDTEQPFHGRLPRASGGLLCRSFLHEFVTADIPIAVCARNGTSRNRHRKRDQDLFHPNARRCRALTSSWRSDKAPNCRFVSEADANGKIEI